MGRPFPLGLWLRIQVPCWFLLPSSHSQDMLLHIDLAGQEPEGTLGKGVRLGLWFLKKKASSRFGTWHNWDVESPNFSPEVSCPPECCPVAGQGMSEPCAATGYLFPFSPHERQSATSVLFANCYDSRLPEHNPRDPIRIPLSSCYLAPHGVILQLYDILGQLHLQSLLLAVTIFNLPETTHFSTGWQNHCLREMGGGRQAGRQGREGGREGGERGKKDRNWAVNTFSWKN